MLHSSMTALDVANERIRLLQSEVDRLQEVAFTSSDTIQKLQAQNERLRMALAFYADEDLHSNKQGLVRLLEDCGKTAQQALRDTEAEGGES